MLLVSVIVPVYNTGTFLAECLESIINQTVKNIEIICVNDGSTDISYEILEEFALKDNRINVIHKLNGGVVSARNAGLGIADGEYICFVDSDDWLEPDMIGTLLKDIGTADLISCGVYRQLSEEKTIRRIDNFSHGLFEGRDGVSRVLKKMIYDFELCQLQPLTPWIYNKLYRKILAKEVALEITEQINYAEDSLFLYKYILKCNSIKIIHDCYYHYRYRKDSAIHSINQRILIDINLVYIELLNDFTNHYMKDSLLPQLERWIALLTCSALNNHMGFDKKVVYIPEFIIDTRIIDKMNLVVYGAGQVGQDAYRQLKKFHYNIEMWADKDYIYYQRNGLDVHKPLDIKSVNYDMILLAVNNEKLALQIKEELIDIGLEKNKIIWMQPYCVY